MNTTSKQIVKAFALGDTDKVAKLSEKWFGAPPKADDAERVVFPGFGPPEMPGYDATPNTAACS
jgi:hypothetical protein